MFCGVFDGHGAWGHFVAKTVRELMPPSLLSNWQETLAQTSLDPECDLESDKKHHRFNIWKHSYVQTCAAIDKELEQHRKIDSFNSGTTALSIVRQVIEIPNSENYVSVKNWFSISQLKMQIRQPLLLIRDYFIWTTVFVLCFPIFM